MSVIFNDPNFSTDLAYTASPTQGTITSGIWTDATIPAADGTNAGLFLPAEKTKLAGIAAGAEVNVNADWNAVSGDAQILNKPTLGTAAATNSTAYATAAQGTKADTAVQPAALASYQPLATALTNTTAAFTTAQETKLAGIAAGAEVNVNADWNAVSGDAQILNKPTLGTAAATNSTAYATAAQGTKADTAVQPAALASYQPLATALTNTTAAFTTAQETKLAGIAEGAEVNVNADWNASSGDAQILNKPTLGTAAATNSTAYATAAQGTKADTAVQPAALASYQPLATALTNTTAAFTTAQETKLAGIAAGAEVNVNADWNASSGDAQILNKPTLGTAAATNSTAYATAAQGAKADTAVQPAALASYQPLATALTNTTAAFTTAQETKLAGIAAGAEVNVNADWNASSGDAQILNKPTLGTAAATNSTAYATAAQGAKADSAVQLVDTWLYGGI